jgi:hypothetical protein
MDNTADRLDEAIKQYVMEFARDSLKPYAKGQKQHES